MSIAFRGTADLPQRALLERFDAQEQAPADAADPAAAAPSADDDAQRAQQGAAAQTAIPWQQRMPPLATDSPAFAIKQSPPTVQREARKGGGGGGNGAGGGDAGGGTGGRSGGDTSRSPGGRDAPAASVQPSAGNASLVRVPVLPQPSARANIGTPEPVSHRDSWIGSPEIDPEPMDRCLPVPVLGGAQREVFFDDAAPPASAPVSDPEPMDRCLPVPVRGGTQGEVFLDDAAPSASAPVSNQEPVHRILPVGGARGWIDDAQSLFGERTPANHGTAKTTRTGASATAAQPSPAATAAAALRAATHAATQPGAPPAALGAAAAGAVAASAMAAAPATTSATTAQAATSTSAAPPAQPQPPQPQPQQPTSTAAPGLDDAWAQDRRNAMGAVQQAYQTARAQAEAAGQFLTTVTESDESGSREVVVFDEAAFTQAWLAGSAGNAGLETLSRLYGMPDAQALIAQHRDVVDLALARGASVGLYEGPPPAGHVMSSAQELQALDGILFSDMNRVLVAQFGQGSVEPPRTDLAREQLRRYGQERYDQMARIERAQAHIQGDFARALEQARNDPNSVGWHDVQEQVQVYESTDESGRGVGPAVTRTVTRREFSVERFSEWYTRAPSQAELQALQADPTAAGNAELLSRMAFAQLYGAAHEVVVNLGSDESGQPMEQREVRFTVQMGGQQHELTLQGDRLVQRDFRAVNLNDPPRLRDAAGVFWNPLLGWSTHETNIKPKRDWFETIVTVVIIAAVSYVSAGTLGPAVAGALGATAGTIGAAVVTGAVVGATTAVVSGAISGNFSWRNVLQGMVLGGVGGAITFGVGELAQSAANTQLANDVVANGGSVTYLEPGAVTSGASQTSYGIGRDMVIEMSDEVLQQQLVQGAQQTFTNVRTVGTVVQSGITSELGGGDFGDGVLGGLSNLVSARVGSGVTQGLADNLGEPMARVIGGVATAGVSSAFVNARGGDGDQAFVSGVVNTGFDALPPASSVPGTAADDRNGADIESDAADAARREQQWVQQSDEIIARRGAETAPVDLPETPQVPGRAPDVGGDDVAPAVPAPARQTTNGVDASSPSADEPPQAAAPQREPQPETPVATQPDVRPSAEVAAPVDGPAPPNFDLFWSAPAPVDSSALSSTSDTAHDRAGETESERAAAAERAAARNAFRQTEIAEQNAAAGPRGDLTPDASAHQVSRGDTVERIAREHYGENWRAGQAAIVGANDLRTNAEGSPLIREGQALELPDLAPASDDQLRALSREGGRITANNSAGLENARIEREAAANQSELARFANRSTAAVGSEATAPQGMSPAEAYAVYMSHGGRSGADAVAPGANAAAAGPYAIDYGDAAAAMNGAVGSGDSAELMNRLRNAPLGVAETLYSGLHNGVVRIAGGAASLPFAIYDGVEATVTGRAGSLSEALEVAANTGVGVQEGFRERYGYRPTSEGAADIARILQPAGEAIQGVVQGARNQSEALIGDGATTVLFGGVQATVEIAATVTGARAAAGLIESRLTVEMASGGDRLLTTMGPARLNNPLEYQAIMSELDAQGVPVTLRSGEYAYGPSARPGMPGNIVVDPNASLSALRHEYGHFLDDQALGFPGMRFYMENPNLRLASERSQYLGEIRSARELGDQTARRELIIDYLRERNVLIETWYTRPYGQ